MESEGLENQVYESYEEVNQKDSRLRSIARGVGDHLDKYWPLYHIGAATALCVGLGTISAPPGARHIGAGIGCFFGLAAGTITSWIEESGDE